MKLIEMLRGISIAVCLFFFLPAAPQGVYTRQVQDKNLANKASEWMHSGEWRNGFEAASPHESVNAVDFYEQYSKNKEQWDAVFKWLRETDLLGVAAGKHPIEGTSLIASVEDSQNGPLETRGTESHRRKIDLQYCVKGVERFGVIDHETSTPNCAYKPDVIHYDYDASKARFYDSSPDRFFIFFPEDWHIAKIANDTQDQDIRVIVFKIDYIP